METGMLWYDAGPDSLVQKVQRAVRYYTQKYGQVPNACLVNPNALDPNIKHALEGVQIRPWRPILPGHLWIGIEE